MNHDFARARYIAILLIGLILFCMPAAGSAGELTPAWECWGPGLPDPCRNDLRDIAIVPGTDPAQAVAVGAERRTDRHRVATLPGCEHRWEAALCGEQIVEPGEVGGVARSEAKVDRGLGLLVADRREVRQVEARRSEQGEQLLAFAASNRVGRPLEAVAGDAGVEREQQEVRGRRGERHVGDRT